MPPAEAVLEFTAEHEDPLPKRKPGYSFGRISQYPFDLGGQFIGEALVAIKSEDPVALREIEAMVYVPENVIVAMNESTLRVRRTDLWGAVGGKHVYNQNLVRPSDARQAIAQQLRRVLARN